MPFDSITQAMFMGDDAPPPRREGAPVLRFRYRNHRGQVGERAVLIAPLMPSMWFGSTEFHPEPQWLLHAYDLDKTAYRDYAVRDILEWLPEPPSPPSGST